MGSIASLVVKSKPATGNEATEVALDGARSSLAALIAAVKTYQSAQRTCKAALEKSPKAFADRVNEILEVLKAWASNMCSFHAFAPHRLPPTDKHKALLAFGFVVEQTSALLEK
jgi:hypothetical protein